MNWTVPLAVGAIYCYCFWPSFVTENHSLFFCFPSSQPPFLFFCRIANAPCRRAERTEFFFTEFCLAKMTTKWTTFRSFFAHFLFLFFVIEKEKRRRPALPHQPPSTLNCIKVDWLFFYCWLSASGRSSTRVTRKAKKKSNKNRTPLPQSSTTWQRRMFS